MDKPHKQNLANLTITIRFAVSAVAYRLLIAVYAMSPYLSLAVFVVALHAATGAAQAAVKVSEGTSVLLPPVASIPEPALSRSESSKSDALNLNFGGSFNVQLEGSETSVPDGHAIANLPNSGSVAATSLMLNGSYEFSTGPWHLKPFVGGGFGFVDANSRVVGQTTSDWQPAYQFHGGLEWGVSHTISGTIEYRQTVGSKSGLYVAGIPTKLDINQHGIAIGIAYKY